MSPRKSVEIELTRDLIIDTARRLFAQSGYQHISMRKIAQELNYSHGALYYHFKNKAELFYAIISRDYSSLNELLSEIINEDLGNKEKITKILLSFIQFGLDHPNHYELMFLTREREVQWQIQQAPNESYEQFAQVLSSLCGPKIHVQEIWFVIIAIHGFITKYCRNEQSYEQVMGLAEGYVRFILKGIGFEEVREKSAKWRIFSKCY